MTSTLRKCLEDRTCLLDAAKNTAFETAVKNITSEVLVQKFVSEGVVSKHFGGYISESEGVFRLWTTHTLMLYYQHRLGENIDTYFKRSYNDHRLAGLEREFEGDIVAKKRTPAIIEINYVPCCEISASFEVTRKAVLFKSKHLTLEEIKAEIESYDSKSNLFGEKISVPEIGNGFEIKNIRAVLKHIKMIEATYKEEREDYGSD